MAAHFATARPLFRIDGKSDCPLITTLDESTTTVKLAAAHDVRLDSDLGWTAVPPYAVRSVPLSTLDYPTA